MSKKVVYITGCLGFIGSAITEQCLERGFFVKGVDKMTYAANKPLLEKFKSHSNFSFVHADINDLKFLYDCDYIINTAAETHVGNSIVSSDEFVRSNIDGVHNILKLLKNYRAENRDKPVLLHFSTDEVMGDIQEGSFNEEALLRPSNPYSATKAAADMLIMAMGRTYELPYVIVRPSNNYGIGQYTEKLIPKTVKYLSLGKKISLHNGGTPVRTWLHVKDTSAAIMQILDNNIREGIYNISGDEHYENLYVVRQILNIYFSRNVENYTDFLDLEYKRAGQDIRYSVDDSKIRKLLNWKPVHNLNGSLPEVVEYYKKNFIW